MTSVTHAFCLQNSIKLHLKEFSVHSKSKKLNVSKIYMLDLVSYILSAVKKIKGQKGKEMKL